MFKVNNKINRTVFFYKTITRLTNSVTNSNENKKRIKPKQYKNFTLLFQYNNKTYKYIPKMTIV